MKPQEPSLLSRLADWFSNGKERKNGSKELERLRSEQLRLSTELEGLLSSYDERTRNLARRLMTSQDESLSSDELAELDAEQQMLWRMVRRLQAADRTVAQLEREYVEWEGRPEGRFPSFHADHPKFRAELIASELRVRGRNVSRFEKASACEGSAKDVDPFSDLFLQEHSNIPDEEQAICNDSSSEPSRIPLSPEIRNSLLEEIRECGRQLRKHHAAPSISPQDIASLYADLRRHHASLREADRRSGVRRYRLGLHE